MDLDTIKILIANCQSMEELAVLETILLRIEPAQWFIESLIIERSKQLRG